jgi:endo-1,4-beta-xylanase
MVAFSSLVIALSVIAGSLAASTGPVKRNVAERGPKDFVPGHDNARIRRSSIKYNQDYTTGGDVSYSPSSSGFSVNWDTEDDFVVGVGWSAGSTK